MPQHVTSVTVVIASPGDTAEERAHVRNALVDFSVGTGRRVGVVALPWLWERQAIPEMGGRPQALINSQAVDRADIVVAFFDSRLGSDTGVDVSGTAEEIHRAVALGKPVHVYFSDEPIPRDADLRQVAALMDFRSDLASEGLLGTYVDARDLAGQVVRAVEHDIEVQAWMSSPPSKTTRGAQLRWRHDHRKEQKGIDGRGRVRYRTTANRLVVENTGDVDVVDLEFTTSWKGSGYDVPPHIDDHSEPITLPAGSQMQWTCVPLGSGNLTIHAKWAEDGQPRERSWSVAVTGR